MSQYVVVRTSLITYRFHVSYVKFTTKRSFPIGGSGGGVGRGGKVGWFFFAPVPLSCDIPLRHNGEKTERRDKLKISKKFLANKNLRFVRLLFLKSLFIIVLARLR